MDRKSPALLGAVLAGGKSSRMGANKAELRPWGADGPTLLEHALDLLGTVTGRQVVSCAQGQKYAGHACIEDSIISGTGPARGLLACLEAAAKDGLDAVLAIGCDQPALTYALLKRLADTFACSPAGTLAALYLNQATGRFEMLAAIYSVDFIDLLAAGLQGGQNSLFQMLPKGRAISLPYTPDEASLFVNLNTPDQFRAFCAATRPLK